MFTSPRLSFPTLSYLHDDGVLDPSCTLKISNDILVQGLKAMITTRLVDEKMITLQRQGTISFALSSWGEEACAVASASALSNSDWLYPQYREPGVLFWRGFPIESYVHQMFGDAKDILQGRQMPNHFGSKALNVVHVSSPIATQIPHAAGCAYAMKLQKESAVSLCYFGEGATSEGDFHVGINFAAVKKAPAIFFCRNNQYAISTPTSKQFASDGVVSKALGYGIGGVRVDGNDFFAIYAAVTEAKKACLAGHGPILIEAMTFRMGAHSTSDDPSVYRKEESVEPWKNKCPIKRLKAYLIKQGLFSEEEDVKFIQKIVQELNEAIEIAKNTPLPPLHSLIEHVYSEVPPELEEQLNEVKHADM